MQNVEGLQQLANDLFRECYWTWARPMCQFVGQNLLTVLKDAVDLLTARALLLKDVEKASECIIIDKLAEQ